MSKTILVGYDGSDTARRAFLFAIDMARHDDGHVHVVSVRQIENGTDVAALIMTNDGRAASDALRTEIDALAPSPGVVVETQIIHGSPGDALLGYVAEHAVDHIVVGQTERGALARWLIGSTSTDVLAKAHVPVTIVR